MSFSKEVKTKEKPKKPPTHHYSLNIYDENIDEWIDSGKFKDLWDMSKELNISYDIVKDTFYKNKSGKFNKNYKIRRQKINP